MILNPRCNKTVRTAYQRIKKSCARPLSQIELEAAKFRVQYLLAELIDLNERIENVSLAAIAVATSSNLVVQLGTTNLDTLKERKLEAEVKIFVYKNIVKECDDLDLEDQKIDEEMTGFLLCGARVFLLAQRSYPHTNIVGSIMECRAGFAWEPSKCDPNSSDTNELAVMLTNNPECYVKLINKVFAAHSMQKFDVLRQEVNCAVLVPFASRIDMSDFTIFCRNDRICLWTRGRFPTAHVQLVEPSSLMYGGEDDDSVDSEDTVDSQVVVEDSDDTDGDD